MNTSSRSERTTQIRQQEVVAELGQQALETGDVDQLMYDTAVSVAETLDNGYCNVLELLPGVDEVLLRQGVGWREGVVGNATVPTDVDSQAGYTLLSEEPVLVDDLRSEERFPGPELLTGRDVVSGISVVIGRDEDPWGVPGTCSTEVRDFTHHGANFVESVANVLASAIDSEETGRELDEDRRELMEFAVGAQRMREMVEGLLGYSRVEIQSDPFETVEPDDVLDGVLADLRLQIEESDVEITAESLPRVEGDTSQLRQVFQNE